jgi:hypothetical protein
VSKRRLMSLDELMEAVENALDSADIDVAVFERSQGGFMERAALSSDSLHRLTRCLRSHGLLNEYTTRPEETP